ncbi:MAG: hypothetical protein ABJN65_12090 [Parasphingorhabdus sp.]
MARFCSRFFLLATLVISSSVISPLSAETLERADGTRIAFHLLNRTDESTQGIVLMLQGSGCEPVTEREWLLTEPSVIAPGRVTLAIEKYGVGESGDGKEALQDDCPAAYWQRNTLSQRVLDAMQVIAHLRNQRWWNGELVIHGGSEGGAVAAMLGPLVPETRAIIIVSSGIGVPVWELIQSAVPPAVAAQIPNIVSEATKNPTPNLRFGGESYRWWADAAYVVPARMLLQTDVPVLLIHGTRDQFAPIDSARATNELFLGSGKTNLTYIELKGYDHFMVDQAGVDHKTDVVVRMAAWLQNGR